MALEAAALAIRGESIERTYSTFASNLYVVNRRYQRKLVWSIEEKRAFIDSILNGYPVPLILLAEVTWEGKKRFEIIDGMQRLNALMAFIEGEFEVDGHYFDLDSMAETKLRVDQGTLAQSTPRLDRRVCANFASYSLPVSVYRFDDNRQIDEIFRRINANGRYLSRQELRQAGATGHFADLVRILAMRIRGDVSAKDELVLNAMQQISITNRELPYGINVDSIFWVAHSILTRDYMRQSRDEELISDLVAYMALPQPPSSGSTVLDDYFGIGEGQASTERHEEVERAVQKIGKEQLTQQFMIVFDQLRRVLASAPKPFNKLMFAEAVGRVPRYFLVVFLAFYELIIKKNMAIADVAQSWKLLDGIGNKFVDIGGGGGNWSAAQKRDNINAVVGVIAPAFKPRKASDPAYDTWVTQFENILVQSFTEQTLYDFKQGLYTLAKPPEFDEDAFKKVCKTLTSIANLGPGAVGYVILGVADKQGDAELVERLYGVKPIKFQRFLVTGIEHEAQHKKGLDPYFRWLVGMVKSQPMPEAFKDAVGREVRLIRYFDKSVVIFRAAANKEPVHFDGKYYVRHGNSVEEVKAESYGNLFARFK